MDDSLIAIGTAIEFDKSSLQELDKIFSKIEKINQVMSNMGKRTSGGQFKEIKNEVVDLQTKINQMMKSIENIKIPNVSNLGKLKQTGLDIQGMTGDWVKFSQTYQTEGNKILKISGAMNTKTEELIVSNAKLTNGLQDNKRATISWSEAINTAFTRLIQWQVATVALFGTLRMLKQGFQDMLEIETQSVNIMKVLNGTEFQKKQQSGLLDKAAINLAKEYGQSVIDVQKAMQSWSRQFKDTDSIIKATRASLLAATATDISFEGSVKHLSAIMAEWGMKVSDVIHVTDVLNQVSNKYRVTAEDVAEGLTKAGAGAKVAGQSFEELTGIITTGIQTLGLSGSEVATMWSRTMARIAGNKGAKEAFEDLGIKSNQSTAKMLDELMVKWDGMTDAQKRNFAITVAGTHHWSKFLQIMNSYGTVLQATADSYFSFNSAQQEVTLMMSTTQKKIAQLNASWQEFMTKNMAVLGATRGVVGALQTMVNGMSATPPVILQIAAALAITIPAIIKFTVAIKAAQKAVADTGSEVTLFKVAAKLLSNPITALITILTLLAGAFIAVGAASRGTQNYIDKMNTEIDGMLANKDKFNSYSAGVDNLSKKYYALSSALSHAQVGTKEYKGLQEKLGIVSKSLINVMDEFGIKTTNLGSDYTKLSGKIRELREEIAKQRLTQLTSLRAKLALDKAELISERDKLQKMLELNKEYNDKKGYSTQYISGNMLKEDIWNQKNKNWFEKAWERYFLFPFNNKGLQKKWQKEIGALSTNISDIGSKELEAALSIAEGKLQSLVDDSSFDESGVDKKKKQISAFYTDLSLIQIEWINALAANLDKAHGLEQETFKVLFTNGDKDYMLKASYETKSMLEGLVKEWESYGKEAQDIIKGVSNAMLEANVAMAQSATNAAQEWDELIGKMKNVPDALKDTLGVGDFYSKRQKEYSNISSNLSKQQDNLLAKIDETKGLISANAAIANNRNANQADREIAQANVENYKKVLGELTEQLSPLIGKMMNAGYNASYYSQQGEQWKQIMNINSEAVQKAFDNVLKAQGAYANAEQQAQMNGRTFKGSAQEWVLDQGQYQAQLDYIQSIKDTITLTEQQYNAQDKTNESTKQYEARIQELNNQLANASKNLGQRPAMPMDQLASIQNKYKPASDEFKKTMEQYGYTFEDIGISTRKELRGLQNALSDYISFLSIADQMISELMVAIANPNIDKKTKESYQTLLKQWTKAKNGAEEALNSLDADIERVKAEAERMQLTETITGAFKAILKGTKSFKAAILEALDTSRSKTLDSFVDDWMNAFNEMNEVADSKSFEKAGNFFKSFKEQWSNMDVQGKANMISLGVEFVGKKIGDEIAAQYAAAGIQIGASVGGGYGAAIGGIIGLAAGLFTKSSQDKKKEKQDRQNLQQSINANSFGPINEYNEWAWEASKMRTDSYHIDKNMPTNTNLDAWKYMMKNYSWKDLANSADWEVLHTLDTWMKLLKALGAGVNDIADGLKNAFSANNYIDFLSNWGQSLESITREALINGFMMQSTYQNLYKTLSSTIGLAVLDGVLSAEEVASIKSQGNALAAQMKVLYQSLALVDNMYAGTSSNSSSGQTYMAGSSVPIVYNNYININAQAFMGDKDDARQFALWIRDEIAAEESRG